MEDADVLLGHLAGEEVGVNALLKHKLTPRTTRQRWVRITVDDADRLRALLEWVERLPAPPGGGHD